MTFYISYSSSHFGQRTAMGAGLTKEEALEEAYQYAYSGGRPRIAYEPDDENRPKYPYVLIDPHGIVVDHYMEEEDAYDDQHEYMFDAQECTERLYNTVCRELDVAWVQREDGIADCMDLANSP